MQPRSGATSSDAVRNASALRGTQRRGTQQRGTQQRGAARSDAARQAATRRGTQRSMQPRRAAVLGLTSPTSFFPTNSNNIRKFLLVGKVLK